VKIVGSVFDIALKEYIWFTHFSPKGAALTSFLNNIDKKKIWSEKKIIKVLFNGFYSNLIWDNFWSNIINKWNLEYFSFCLYRINVNVDMSILLLINMFMYILHR